MRLIDADALKLYIDKEVEENKVIDGWAFFFKVYLDNAPSIDIVRCGECMHNGSYDTDCPFRWKDGEWNMPKPCDFCSYGERSE